MTAGALAWRKAVSVSCAAHLFVGLCFGAAQDWPKQVEKETLIEVELATERPAAGAHRPDAAAPGAPSAPPGAAPAARARSETQSVAAAQEGLAPAKSPALPAPRAVRTDGAFAAPSPPPAASVGGGGAASDGGSDGGGNGGSGEGGGGGSGTGGSGGAGSGGGQGVGRAAAMHGFVARVEAHKKYPYMALKRNLAGRSVVYVELSASGELAALTLAVSSGVASLDQAALEAVRSACPYRHGLGAALAMEVPVQYRLSGG